MRPFEEGQLVEVQFLHESQLLIRGDLQMVVFPGGNRTAEIHISITEGIDPFLYTVFSEAIGHPKENHIIDKGWGLKCLRHAYAPAQHCLLSRMAGVIHGRVRDEQYRFLVFERSCLKGDERLRS